MVVVQQYGGIGYAHLEHREGCKCRIKQYHRALCVSVVCMVPWNRDTFSLCRTYLMLGMNAIADGHVT